MYGVSLKQFVIDLHREITDHNVFNGAAALAYYMMLAIFPTAIFMLTLLPFLPIPNLEQVMADSLNHILPKESATLLMGVVDDVTSQRRGGLLSFGLIFLIWSASSGLYAIMQQLNVTYDVREGRPFWKTRGTAMLLMVLFFLFVLGGFALIVFGGTIENIVGSHLRWQTPLIISFAVFRWTIILICLLLAFSTIYYLGPDIEQEFKFFTPGSIIGVILLSLASLGFQFYVGHFSDYSSTYGSLGAAIVLQLWLYITGLVLLVGSEVNVLIRKYRQKAKNRRNSADQNERRAA